MDEKRIQDLIDTLEKGIKILKEIKDKKYLTIAILDKNYNIIKDVNDNFVIKNIKFDCKDNRIFNIEDFSIDIKPSIELLEDMYICIFFDNFSDNIISCSRKNLTKFDLQDLGTIMIKKESINISVNTD